MILADFVETTNLRKKPRQGIGEKLIFTDTLYNVYLTEKNVEKRYSSCFKSNILIVNKEVE